MSRGSEPTLIASVQRALRLLEVVGEHPGGVTAKCLARTTGLALPTTYHLLRTLVHEGYLQKLDDGAFIVGDQVSGLHSAAQAQQLRSRVRRVMTDLREALNAAIYLACYRDGEVSVDEIVDSPRTPRVDAWVDFREAAHATAVGKCLLSSLSKEQRSDHFRRYPPEDLTPRTITGLRELVECPASPLVTDTEEYSLGTACLAAPVRFADSPVTLAISFPVRRLATTGDYVRPLRAAADEVSRVLAVAGEHSDRN
ncbi:IclR family transcriptional regulator [Saccharopolyspora rhizosphaerae]|uniref:IclR family transcriptional regulator n=1 Tax=Saccharopolyspora rhizosphaerae TaxID=2492662 RepID=A0A426JI33_9PSEU|nr:IclR family transcriptional regulator C-terminal domain-containing protein [Saccharopolyspora rhizosphaerae]RRO12809.1 IclR family transcriptional regulator [Saccharopolyspora rhizosphaerae]